MDNSQSPFPLRTVRSFTRRKGRITPRQQAALAALLSTHHIPLTPGSVINIDATFQRHAPCFLEIGLGKGEVLIEMAKKHPHANFIGIEVYEAGIGAVLASMQEEQLSNIRVIQEDAMVVLRDHIAPQSLAGIHLFFADPWPKKRHHKRRIVQKEFVELVVNALEPGGYIHMATDWQPYAEHMLEVLTATPALNNQAKEGGYIERPATRSVTKFESRGHRLGHGVWDLYFVK